MSCCERARAGRAAAARTAFALWGGLGAGLGMACQPPPAAGPAEPGGGAPVASASDADDGAESAYAGPRLDPDVARAETIRILHEVAKARNLEVTGSVQVNVVDRAGIRAFAKESMYEHDTPQRIAELGRIQATLGVMPRGTDPEAVLLDLLEDGVLGFYDPKAKTLHIGDFVTKGMLSMVVGHEIAHGLQDMHFDLAKHQLPIEHDNDGETARRFLIEGGAQATYLAWISGERGVAAIADPVLDAMGNQTLDLAALQSPYPILARTLQLPYADGTATVARLVRRDGWKAIDALYADLPATSEQMLHLDKLLSREPARPVTFDRPAIAAALPGLDVTWHDNLGEAELLAMIADVTPSLTARKAAAGWGGDQIVALDRTGDPLPVPLVLGAITWDTVDDAREFETVFADYLRERVSDGALQRRKQTVAFVAGVPTSLTPDRVLEVAWSALTTDAPVKGRRG